MHKKVARIVGVIGIIVCLYVFLQKPSFPTPDKLLVFGAFVAMVFSQTWEFLKRFVPFVFLLLAYESFRGIVPHLNSRVNFLALPAFDRFIFLGHLPTTLLQNLLWNGRVQWYDFVFYLAYMLHFVLPFLLAVVVWKIRESEFWRYVTTYISVSFAGFVTFLLFPAAPPWLASDKGLIEPIVRISSKVWYALGIHDFPSLYNKISPNPVAALPSLHAAYSTLFALFMTTLFKSKWRYLAWIYPLLIYVGTVYQGEHYAIDEIVGALYALVAFYSAPQLIKIMKRTSSVIINELKIPE